MKIQSAGFVQGKQGVVPPAKTDEAKLSKGARAEDTVQVSEVGAEILSFTKMMEKIPDVRMEKVDHFQGLVRQGRYKADADQTAEAILKGNFIDSEI